MTLWQLFETARGCVLFAVLYKRNNDIGTAFDSDRAAVEADVIILSGAPGSSGVMLIIYPATLIFFLQTRLRTLFRVAIKTYNAVCTEIHVGIDIGVEAVIPVLQDIVGVSAYDYTGTLLCYLQDHATLDVPQKVSC